MTGTFTPELLDDLLALKSGESTTLEFKSALPEFSDRGKAELLKDASAFANSLGGAIIFGIAEQDGVADQYSLPTIADSDALIRRIAQVLDTGVEPRLSGSAVYTVEVGQNQVLIVEIPPQTRGPYRFRFNNHFRFVKRNDRHISDLSYDELRTAFSPSETSDARCHRSWSEWFSKSKYWASLQHGPGLFVGTFPMQWARNRNVDLKDLEATWDQLIVAGWGGGSHAFNFEGLVVYPGPSNQPLPAFQQIDRRGFLVGFRSLLSLHGEEGVIYGGYLVGALRKIIAKQNQYLVRHGVRGPAIIYFGVRDIDGYLLMVPGRYGEGRARNSHIGEFNSLPIWLEELSTLNVDANGHLQDNLDYLWQAFGEPTCPESFFES